MSDVVLYEVDGRVALITLNRPEARNAVNGDVAKGLEAAIDRLEADDEVWVGILAANTEGQERPVFSRRRRPQGDQRRQRRRPAHQAWRLRRLRLPRAAQADHRRRRRPRHGRRLRDRPRRRPRRRHDPLLVRAGRGQAQPRRRRRRSVPPALGDRPGGGDGGHPHRRADPRRAGLRPRPRSRGSSSQARPRSPRPGRSPTRSPVAHRWRCGRAAPSCAPRRPRTRRAEVDDRRAIGRRSWGRRTSRRASRPSSRSGRRTGRVADHVGDTVISRAVIPARS